MYREFFHGEYIWWLMPLFHMFGFIIFILIVAAVIRTLSSKGRGYDQASHTPLDILKERYARGEITREEFHRMKDDLKR